MSEEHIRMILFVAWSLLVYHLGKHKGQEQPAPARTPTEKEMHEVMGLLAEGKFGAAETLYLKYRHTQRAV